MKKIIITMITVFMAVISTGRRENDTLVALSGGLADSVLRFHIIANSDSKEDQELKLKVRDNIAQMVAEDINNEGIDSKDKAEEYVRANINKYTLAAEKVIQSEGYSYTACGSVGKSWFPVKIYGNYIFPEGEYDAFRIFIGKAEGKNWWCVLFPSLCMVDEAYQITEGYENEPIDGSDSSENIKFGFRIVEWIRDMW